MRCTGYAAPTAVPTACPQPPPPLPFACKVGGSSKITTQSGTTSTVNTSRRVPVGARRIRVVHPEYYAPGDLITITRPGTDAWVVANGMDSIPSCTPPLAGRSCSQWEARHYNLYWERTVVSKVGDELELDAPLVEALDAAYGGGEVNKALDQRIAQIGIEMIQFKSEYNASLIDENRYATPPYAIDEEHSSTAIEIGNVVDGWVSRVRCLHFVLGCAWVGYGAKHVTVENSSSLEPVSLLTSGRRCDHGLIAVG